jgi:HK97 gp10 family phage protein
MFTLDVNVTGLEGLVDRMSKLPDKLQRKGAQAAARKAMTVVRDAARATARGFDDAETPNAVWRNIVTQASARGGRRIGGVNMRVGVRGGAAFSEGRASQAAGNPGGYTWYWRFLELKTEGMARQEFLLPAMERNAQAVTDRLAVELSREIDKLTSTVTPT